MADSSGLSVEKIIQAYTEYKANHTNGTSFATVPMLFQGSGTPSFDQYVQSGDVSKFCDMLIEKGLVKTAKKEVTKSDSTAGANGSTSEAGASTETVRKSEMPFSISSTDMEKAIKKELVDNQTDMGAKIAGRKTIGTATANFKEISAKITDYNRQIQELDKKCEPLYVKDEKGELNGLLTQKQQLESKRDELQELKDSYTKLINAQSTNVDKANEDLQDLSDALNKVKAYEGLYPELVKYAQVAYNVKSAKINDYADKGVARRGDSGLTGTHADATRDADIERAEKESKSSDPRVAARGVQLLAQATQRKTDAINHAKAALALVDHHPTMLDGTKEEYENGIKALEPYKTTGLTVELYDGSTVQYSAKQIQAAIDERQKIVDNQLYRTDNMNNDGNGLKNEKFEKFYKSLSEGVDDISAYNAIRKLTNGELLALLKNAEQWNQTKNGHTCAGGFIAIKDGLMGEFCNDDEAIGLIMLRLKNIRKEMGLNLDTTVCNQLGNDLTDLSGATKESAGYINGNKAYDRVFKLGSGHAYFTDDNWKSIYEELTEGMIFEDKNNKVKPDKTIPKKN